MNSSVSFVDYKEPLSIQVGNWILQNEKELVLASSGGCAYTFLQEENDSISFILEDPRIVPKRYFFGLISQKPRRDFIGTIWFENEPRGAHEGRWVFEVYGRKHVELAKRLALELSSTFSSKITVHLVSEQTREETYLSDYDF